MSRLVMIDRDGTLVEERHYLSSPEDLVLVDRAAEAIRLLRDGGLIPVVITNQSAIGRGYFDTATLDRIHARLGELLAADDASLEALYVCPHIPEDGCSCRKPAAGLALRAAREFGANLSESFVIGDKDCDIDLGRNVGATTILVRTGYGGAVADRAPQAADYVVENLFDAACLIRDIVSSSKGAASS